MVFTSCCCKQKYSAQLFVDYILFDQYPCATHLCNSTGVKFTVDTGSLSQESKQKIRWSIAQTCVLHINFHANNAKTCILFWEQSVLCCTNKAQCDVLNHRQEVKCTWVRPRKNVNRILYCMLKHTNAHVSKCRTCSQSTVSFCYKMSMWFCKCSV